MRAPCARVASTFERGASSGITSVALHPSRARCDRHRLRVIAGRIRHHAARQLFAGKLRDKIRRAANLERAAGLEILALEERFDAALALKPREVITGVRLAMGRMRAAPRECLRRPLRRSQ